MTVRLLNQVGQTPQEWTCVEGDARPTASANGVTYGSRLFEYNAVTLRGVWYVYTLGGWGLDQNQTILPGTAEADIAAINAALALLSTILPDTASGDLAAMKAKIDTVQADIALIKAGIPVSLSAEIPVGTKNIGDVDVASLPTANLYPVKIHTIAITIVNAAAAQTDVIYIDGVVCSFTSDATPTAAEIVAGLAAAIAASSAAGKFVVTGTTTLILTPAYAYTPIVEVSANLTDTETVGLVSLLGVRLSSGESHLGEVGGSTFPVVVTPVVGAAVFHANDIVGGKLTLPFAARRPQGSGIIYDVSIVDAAKQATELCIYFFNADLTVAADNAAEATSAADMLKYVGHVVISAADYRTLANASAAKVLVNISYKLPVGTTLYAFIRCTGTPTFTANCLQLKFGMLRD